MALKEINRSAAIAWCPVRKNTCMLALGSVGMDPLLELCSFDMSESNNKIDIIAAAKADTRFRCIAWGGASNIDTDHSPMKNFNLGIIAGGMEGGAVTLWDPAVILKSKGAENGFISTVQAYKKMVSCLEFNPHRMHLIASGGADGEVHIIDINNPQDVAMYKPGTDDRHVDSGLTALAWNRRVSHILATACNSGITVIWDLKQQKPAISFRDPGHRERPSSLAWLPEQATQIVVAYDDERNPSLQLWDLRNANYPLRDTAGHSKGILAASFNDMDSNLMLSCGKDNRTVCWTFTTGQAEIFSEIPTQQWHLQIKWSPFLPGIFAAASHTDKVEIYSMQQNTAPHQLYVPKWFKRPCGVHCGFGGKIVTFNSNSTTVKCHVVPTDKELIARADMFEQLLNEGDYIGYCNRKLETYQDGHERLTWSLVRLLFEENARAGMVKELGYNSAKIIASVEKYLGHKPGNDVNETDSAPANSSNIPMTEVDPEKFFKELGEKNEAELLEREASENLQEQQQIAKVVQEDADWTTGPENLIKKSVLIGNLPAAVDVCLKHGRMADALLLASTGDPQLWIRTRQKYIDSQTDNFLKMIGCILNNDLSKLVASSDLESWQEGLAILCTYARPEELKTLCEKLGHRLEQEKFDIRAAVICYLCAGNFSSTVQIWSNMAAHHGSMQAGLQDLVEKMAVLKAATNFNGHDNILTQNITKYAEILANSGRLIEAMRYLCLVNDDMTLHSALLRDRIYHSSPENMQSSGIPCPPKPFEILDIPVDVSLQQNVYRKHMQQPGGLESSQMYGSSLSQMGISRSPGTVGVNNTSMPSVGSSYLSSMQYQVSYTPHTQSVRPMNMSSNIHNNSIHSSPPSSIPPIPPNMSSINNKNINTNANTNTNTTNTMNPVPASNSYYNNYNNTNRFHTVSQPLSNTVSLPSNPPTNTTVSRYPPNTPYINNNYASPSINTNNNIPAYPSSINAPPIQTNTPTLNTPSNRPPIPAVSHQDTYTNIKQQSSNNVFTPRPPSMPMPPSNITSNIGSNKLSTPYFSSSNVEDLSVSNNNRSIPSRPVTAPTVAATPVRPGMPVPWPIPTTSQQLASITYSTAEANQRVHAAAVKQNEGVPIPPGDFQFVTRVLNELLAVQTQQDAFSRRTEDLKKKIEELYEKLQQGVLEKKIVEKILQFCTAVDRRDYVTAQRLHIDLSNSAWESNKNWLMGLKRLLPK